MSAIRICLIILLTIRPQFASQIKKKSDLTQTSYINSSCDIKTNKSDHYRNSYDQFLYYFFILEIKSNIFKNDHFNKMISSDFKTAVHILDNSIKNELSLTYQKIENYNQYEKKYDAMGIFHLREMSHYLIKTISSQNKLVTNLYHLLEKIQKKIFSITDKSKTYHSSAFKCQKNHKENLKRIIKKSNYYIKIKNMALNNINDFCNSVYTYNIERYKDLSLLEKKVFMAIKILSISKNYYKKISKCYHYLIAERLKFKTNKRYAFEWSPKQSNIPIFKRSNKILKQLFRNKIIKKSHYKRPPIQSKPNISNLW